MKNKSLGSLIAAALALMAFASTATATTVEIKGAKQTGVTTIKASLKSQTSLLITDTFGFFAQTCVEGSFIPSALEFKMEGSATGTTVGGTQLFTPGFCTEQPIVTDTNGTFSIENMAGSTDGTVRSTGTKMTYPSPFGPLNCTTSNTDLGRITGAVSGKATLDVNAVLNCGVFLSSAKWTATYTVTSPEGLGLTA